MTATKGKTMENQNNTSSSKFGYLVTVRALYSRKVLDSVLAESYLEANEFGDALQFAFPDAAVEIRIIDPTWY